MTSYLYAWFMWMPARWAKISINPEVNPWSYDTFEASRDLSCMICGTPTRTIRATYEGPLCSMACAEKLDWNYRCARAGKRRWLQWRFWLEKAGWYD